jgi:hypothetical protein
MRRGLVMAGDRQPSSRELDWQALIETVLNGY